MEIKTKVSKWGQIKLKSFSTAKETVSKVKRQPSKWEKIIANRATDRGSISKIYKQLMHLDIRRNKQPNQKMGRRPKQTFLQRRYTDGQQTHEKMLHTVHYLRNANQNYMRCHDIAIRMVIIKKSTINAGEDVKKREPSCIVGGNVN